MLKRLFTALIILSLTIFPFVLKRSSEAAALGNLSDTLSRLQATTLSSHTIAFDMPAGDEFAAAETITYDFDEDGGGWTVDGAASVVGDFDFNDGTGDQNIVDVDGDCTGHSGVTDVVIGINDTTGVVTVTACANYDGSGNGATITLEYGAAAGGTNRVTNPGAGSTTLAINHASGTNTGQLAVPIMTGDQVTVSAAVDPSITSALSSSTCALGTLDISQVYGCTYTNTVDTNAGSGFASTIIEDGELRTGGGDTIDEVTDGTVTANNEEYGVSSSDTTNTPDIADYDGTCGGGATEAGSAITGTEKTYSNASGPVSSNVTTLCHAAAVAGSTAAGSYQHIVTHITTGTF